MGTLPKVTNLEIAAQCWCDKETGHIEMIPCLAEAFAKRLDDKDKLISDLQDLAQWMTGCGYDFCQHEFYTNNRHLLTDGVVVGSSEVENEMQTIASTCIKETSSRQLMKELLSRCDSKSINGIHLDYGMEEVLIPLSDNHTISLYLPRDSVYAVNN